MSSRRDFIRQIGIAGAGMLIPWSKLLPDTPTQFFDTSKLTKFKDPLLSAIPVAKPVWENGHISHYTITMEEGSCRFHSEMPVTKTWGYGGLGYLGPTIETRENRIVIIKWVNNLPSEHIFEQDEKLLEMLNVPSYTRACVHLHGGKVPEKFDGSPESWFASGRSFEALYPNIQDARQMWYHDHALGQTRLNAYAGLAGLWFIRDDYEDSLNLPKGPYEIPLVIQDKQFDINGQLFYLNPWGPEFFGDAIMVNRTIWPRLEVEPRKYRFRMLNASQARFFNIYLDNNVPMYQIGTEGGFLPGTVIHNFSNQLVLGCAERADVIVDFSSLEGKEIIMRNTGLAPADIGDPPTCETGVIMKFIVSKPLQGESDTSSIPQAPKHVHVLKEKSAVHSRNITLHEVITDMWEEGMPMQINNRPFLGSTPTETPRLGSTEIWNFINLSPDTHPMHMHLVNFQVLDRTPFSIEAYREKYGNSQAPEGASLFATGNPIAPAEDERGWKDTVKCPGGFITRIIVRFDGFPGKFVYHCHILDHEENDMMQYMIVKHGMSKDTDEDGNAAIPVAFALHQNFPNPFNPATTIQFQLPDSGPVQIKIYDSIGKEIVTLADQVYEPGTHSITWNGTNSYGKMVPSGIYIYTMISGGFKAIKKMILLK
ncbi:MAG TPA: multicopper oxidase domain-containing protein [Ignavibacteriales bacterium]|nr:multicopper oxidase domain-containing protein [Ignavibacteriales bacterium]